MKRLTYDNNDLYDNSYHTIYFVNMNSNELRKWLEFIDVNILSFIIDDKKYYVNDIDELEYEYVKDKDIVDKIIYYNNGIKIDGMNVLCSSKELIVIDNIIKTY